MLLFNASEQNLTGCKSFISGFRWFSICIFCILCTHSLAQLSSVQKSSLSRAGSPARLVAPDVNNEESHHHQDFGISVGSLSNQSTQLVLARPFKATIASIFVRQSDLTVYYEIVKPAIELAVEVCNRRFAGHLQLTAFVRNDSKLCLYTVAPSLAAEMYYLRQINAFVGPSCMYALDNVARLASFWNVPVFTAGGSSVEFNDKTLFTTLSRLSYSLERVSDFLMQVLREFEWRHVSFIMDEDDLTMMPVERSIKQAIREERTRDFEISHITSYFLTSNNRSVNHSKHLLEASLESRVIVLLMKGNLVREFMLAAYDLNMHLNGEYTFIAVELIKAKKADTIEWYKYGDKRNRDAKVMFESLLVIAVRIPVTSEYKNFVYEVAKRARNEFKMDFSVDDVNQNVAAFYDSVLMYCMALNETLSNHENPNNGRQLVSKLWNRVFMDGITGEILINSNGDRETDYTLEDLDPETGQFRSVLNYFGAKRKLEKIMGVSIHWPGKRDTPPLDVPYCGFRNENPICIRKNDYTVFLILTVLLIVSTIAGLFAFYKIYQKMNYEAKINDNWWKLHWEDIKFAERGVKKSTSSIGKSDTSFKTFSHSGKTSVISSMATTLANVDASILCGHYKGIKVAVKPVNIPKLTITRENLIEFKQMREIMHNNLVRFVGVCIEEPNVAIVNELCVRGSLRDMLENDKLNIDWTFKCSMINDVVEGMCYLHASPIEYHGHLKSTNLVVDSRFNVAICDYGLRSIYAQIKVNSEDFNARSLFWTAPEHLRDKYPSKSGSRKGDVYSFGIILQEIITRMGAFENLPTQHKHLVQEPEELLDRIKAGGIPPFRPEVAPEDCEAPEILPLMALCWSETPSLRPDFNEIKIRLKKITRGITSSKLLDNLMKRIESYSSNLERIVQEKTENIIEEKQRAEQLLNNILPRFIVEQLKSNTPVVPEVFNSVSIMFSDIVGFQQLSSVSSPPQIVTLLNDIYTTMDAVLSGYDVYKVETIADAYLVASGVPVRNGMEHVREIAECALEARDQIAQFKARHKADFKFAIRIGIQSGPCVAGVIGLKMPKYCLFGDTINTASRMETNGEAGKIHITPKTKELLDMFGNFVILPRGEVQIKGKGMMKTFWLESVKKAKNRSKPSSKSSSLDHDI